MQFVKPQGNNMAETEMLSREFVEDFSRSRFEPEWLLDMRLKAWEIFQSKRVENYIYGLGIATSLKDIDFNTESSDTDALVKNKPEKAVIMELGEAVKKYPDAVRKHLFSKFFSADPANVDKFSALHAALWKSGIFIYLPENSSETKPIYVDLLSKGFSSNHILIVAEPNSRAVFVSIEKTGQPNPAANPESHVLNNSAVEIYAAEGSEIKYGNVQMFSENVFNLTERTGVVEKDASITWIICDLGSCLTKSDLTTRLVGQGASVKNISLFFGHANQQFDFSANAIHECSDTTSNIIAKGALNHKSKSIYRGLVKILQDAARCSGSQKEDTILLSSDAEADAIPNLEIDNNDVKCSHAATIGHIDAEKLFYLMSRGLPENLARQKIVEGFFDPVIAQIPIERLQEELRNMISERSSGE